MTKKLKKILKIKWQKKILKKILKIIYNNKEYT